MKKPNCICGKLQITTNKRIIYCAEWPEYPTENIIYIKNDHYACWDGNVSIHIFPDESFHGGSSPYVMASDSTRGVRITDSNYEGTYGNLYYEVISLKDGL